MVLILFRMEVNKDVLDAIVSAVKEKTERDLIFMFVQGSQNYNLDTPQSDIDCKAFTVPTFADLYFGKRYSTTIDTDYGQVTIHDIRMLPELLFKMNPTYLEMFFSKHTWFPSEEKKQELLEAIPLLKDYPALFNALFKYRKYHMIESLCGVFKTKCRETLKPTFARRPLLEKYGYDTKAACHGVRYFRLLTLAISAATHSSSKSAYDKFLSEYRLQTDNSRDFLMNIKQGYLPKEDALALLNNENEYVKWARDEFDPYCKTETEGILCRELNDSIYQYCKKQYR